MEVPPVAKLRRGLVNIQYTYFCGEASAPQIGTLPLASSADKLQITDLVRKISSEFPNGKRCAPDFMPLKEREQARRQLSNRGRKRKHEPKGGNFSSQMALYLWYQGQEIQAKVFVKNHIHLPKPPEGDYDNADDVVRLLVDYLNSSFEGLPGYRPIFVGPRRIKLSNYSGSFALGPRKVLDLDKIRALFLEHKDEMPLPFAFCSHVVGDPKLSLGLCRLDIPAKRVTIQIQLRGKIAIMGDNDTSRIETVFHYVHGLLTSSDVVLDVFR